MRRLALVLLAVGCVGPQDDPSQVHDLRVISASFSPPEIMAPSCSGLIGGALDGGMPNLAAFISFAAPIDMKWLVLDPQQRDISWDLRACTSQGDLECDDDGGYVPLASGVTKPGVVQLQSPLALQTLSGSLFDGGRPLIQGVIEADAFRGFGGIRVPVVMHVIAGTEEVFAQKLMVYNCKLFDEQKANVLPVIPGVTYQGKDWPESLDGGPTMRIGLKDATELVMSPTDFSALEEDYVVPSVSLKPVQLKESWKFSWHTSLGRFSPTTSGGTDFTGMLAKPWSTWLPRADGGVAGLTEQDVDFWIVVRDGRGGESWITRKAHFVP